MNVCVVGTGYVGLVTGTCLAEMGNKVWCVDKDQEKINLLNTGVSPIYEPGIEELINKNSRDGRLHFSSKIQGVLGLVDICFIAVGTPPGEDGSADLKYVMAVAQEIGEYISKPMVIVNKSTVPVGTGTCVKNIIKTELAKRSLDIQVDIVSNPEFLKEGAAIKDFMSPDRIIVGVDNEYAKEKMQELYAPFFYRRNRIIFMDIKSAELTKYAANAMLATRISFMNELTELCDKSGADILKIREGLASDPRIGEQFLYAGIGYGGSCFPKDLKELLMTAKRFGIKLGIVTAVEEANRNQKEYFFNLIKNYFENSLHGVRIAIWGLAFKPQTDDIREAPALYLIEKLQREGAILTVYDPQAMKNTEKYLRDKEIENVNFAATMNEAVIQADALILATEWRQFRQPDFREIAAVMRRKVIFDGRNQYSIEIMKKYGFEYFGIGRGNHSE